MLAVSSGVGLLLGALAALGWHWQPVIPGAGPSPRFVWMLPGDGGPYYSGFIGDEELAQWAPFTWPPAVGLLVFGALTGCAVAAGLSATRWRVAPSSRSDSVSSPLMVSVGGLGLVVGAAATLAWHLLPPSGLGGPWLGGFFWPVDVGYPVVGVVTGTVIGVVFARGRMLVRAPAPEAGRPDR